jgi:hypothetical protein
MGRTCRPGQQPFRLNIDRLMRESGGLGDLLASLLDSQGGGNRSADGSHMRPDWWKGEDEHARSLSVRWWRLVVAKYANGMWPERFLGPGPWDAEHCLVPDVLLDELELRRKYPAPAA